MTKKYLYTALACGMAVSMTSLNAATELLSTGDNVIAVGGHVKNNSSYPAAELPYNVVDQVSSTKYLNHGIVYTGFIVTPSYGASTIKSFRITTANDAEARDPSSYELYGTNEEIKSTDNSFGDGEEWTLISQGTLALPAERLAFSDFIAFENEVAYTSYRMVFPTVKDSANGSMQVADVQFYEQSAPNPDEDFGILTAQDLTVLAIQLPVASDSSYATADWDTSKPQKAVNKTLTDRYANLAKTDVGLALWPLAGLTKLESFELCTFTNLSCCDPTGYKIYGTLDHQLSADNSLGTNEVWTLLSEGSLNMPLTPTSWSDRVMVNAEEFFRGYKLLFTGIRDAADTNATVVHIAEMQFYGAKQDVGGTPLLTPGDVARPINATKDFFYWTTNSTYNGNYPAAESPAMCIDGSVDTKYLNGNANNAGAHTGFIVTPAASSTVKSFKIWTANDAADRNPTSYSLWGRNDAYTETDNSISWEDGWTLISEGALALPTTFKTEGPLVSFSNDADYKYYRMVFPTLNGGAMMQISDVQFYSDSQGTEKILAPENTIIAIAEVVVTETARMKLEESPQHALDVNTATKYCSSTGTDTGIIFEPIAGKALGTKSIVKAITMTTANDYSERDPATFALYGTNDKLVSEDYSHGDQENWTLIAEGELGLPEARKTSMDEAVKIDNATPYTFYKILFPTVRGLEGVQEGVGIQFAEIQFYGDIVGEVPSNLINATDDIFLAVRSAFSPSSKYNTTPLESSAMALDGDVNTKYLNGGNYTNRLGMIITPTAGKKSIQWMEFSTANDAEGRDPTSFELYGTDDPITSVDNGDGSSENWTLVAKGELSFPAERLTTGITVDLGTPTPEYTSWKILFPTIKGGTETAMQFADIQFMDPLYTYFLTAEDFSIAVGDYMSGSAYPGQEGPFAIADNEIKVKYLNRGGAQSGFIVTPAEQTTPTAVMYTTANDNTARDPLTVAIYGTDDEITTLDNGSGTEENWTLVGEGTFRTDDFRFRNSSIVYFSNETPFKSYKVLFPTLKGTIEMQVAEFYFFDLSAPEGPVITVQPASQTAEMGENVTFSVEATGEGKLYYQWQREGVAIEGATEATYTIENVNPGYAMSYTVLVSNEGGDVLSNPALLTVALEPDPSDYSGAIVGSEAGALKGYYDYTSASGVFTVNGCGSDTWGATDHFYFLYREVPAGDFSFSARMTGFECPGSEYGRAGLMLREGTAEGSLYEGSRYIVSQVYRQSDAKAYRTQFRTALDESVESAPSSEVTATWPNWQKIARVGTVLTISYSADGKTWTDWYTVDTAEWKDGALGSSLPLYVGLWNTSHSVGQLSPATFDNVVFENGDAPVPTKPVLAFSVADGKLILRWAASANASLEVSTKATGEKWTLAGTPARIEDGTCYYEITISESSEAYYRLNVGVTE